MRESISLEETTRFMRMSKISFIEYDTHSIDVFKYLTTKETHIKYINQFTKDGIKSSIRNLRIKELLGGEDVNNSKIPREKDVDTFVIHIDEIHGYSYSSFVKRGNDLLNILRYVRTNKYSLIFTVPLNIDNITSIDRKILHSSSFGCNIENNIITSVKNRYV